MAVLGVEFDEEVGCVGGLDEDGLEEGARPLFGDEVADGPLVETLFVWGVDVGFWLEWVVSLVFELWV